MDSQNKANFIVHVDLDHVGLYVQDLDKSLSWYNKFLGFRLSDYLPRGNKEEPVAPDGIAWMRYGNWHHDLTLIQLPSHVIKNNQEEAISNLKEVSFLTNSKETLKKMYGKFNSTQIIKPLESNSKMGFSSFTAIDPDKNKITVLHNPSVLKTGGNDHFSQIISLSHVTIWSKNTEISQKWYQSNLGLTVKSSAMKNSIEMINARGETKLIIDQTPGDSMDKPLSYGGRGSMQQIAFKVKNEKELLDSYNFLVKNEVEIIQPPRPQNWSKGTKFYFLDPNKNKLEIEAGQKSVETKYGSKYDVVEKLNLLH